MIDTLGVALLMMNSWVLDLVKSVTRIVPLLLILVMVSSGVIRPAQDTAFAQSPQCWAKTYGGGSSDRAYCVRQTSDGGYIVAGSTQSFGAGDWDFWILKIVADGSIEWQKTYGGISNERAYSIQQTFDGGYIVCGYTWSFGAGGSDFCILKLAPSGSIEWQKTCGETSWEYPYSIQQTSDDGYIVAGHSNAFLGGRNSDYWVLKLASNGSIEWQKTYGGTTWDGAYSIQQTSDGGYIVAGETFSFGAGNADFWVLKLTSNGDIEWQKAYGGADDDRARSIQQISDGGYIVAGETFSFGAGNIDIWVIKLFPNGGIEWQKTYGGVDDELVHSVQQTSDGGYIVASETSSFGAGNRDGWLLKLASNGNAEWQQTWGSGGWDRAHSIQQTSGGGYIVAGSTDLLGAGNEDFWILRFDEEGNIPECSLGIGSDISVTDTQSPAADTLSTGNDTITSVSISSYLVSDSSCITNTQCFYSSAAPIVDEAPLQDRSLMPVLGGAIAIIVAIGLIALFMVRKMKSTK